jgi:hypothetical protein
VGLKEYHGAAAWNSFCGVAWRKKQNGTKVCEGRHQVPATNCKLNCAKTFRAVAALG